MRGIKWLVNCWLHVGAWCLNNCKYCLGIKNNGTEILYVVVKVHLQNVDISVDEELNAVFYNIGVYEPSAKRRKQVWLKFYWFLASF